MSRHCFCCCPRHLDGKNPFNLLIGFFCMSAKHLFMVSQRQREKARFLCGTEEDVTVVPEKSAACLFVIYFAHLKEVLQGNELERADKFYSKLEEKFPEVVFKDRRDVWISARKYDLFYSVSLYHVIVVECIDELKTEERLASIDLSRYPAILDAANRNLPLSVQIMDTAHLRAEPTFYADMPRCSIQKSIWMRRRNPDALRDFVLSVFEQAILEQKLNLFKLDSLIGYHSDFMYRSAFGSENRLLVDGRLSALISQKADLVEFGRLAESLEKQCRYYYDNLLRKNICAIQCLELEKSCEINAVY